MSNPDYIVQPKELAAPKGKGFSADKRGRELRWGQMHSMGFRGSVRG